MPEPLDATPGAPSTPPPEHVPFEELNDAQHADWMKTGELPVKEAPKAAASAPAKESSASEKDGKPAASEAAKPQRKNAEDRKAELSAEIQSLLERRAVLKSDDLWKELEEFRAKKSAPADTGEKKADPPAASASELKEPERPKRPRLGDFPSTEEYEAAMDKYDEALLAYPAKTAAYSAAKTAIEKQRADFTASQEKLNKIWTTIAGKGRELYSDFDTVSLDRDLPLREGEPVERYLRDSEPETAAHLLQFLGTNRKELERINGLSSRLAFKELEKLEEKVLADGDKPITPPKEKPETKRVTSALKPPIEVGGRGTAPEDDEDAAVRAGDTDRYFEIANKRDIAARKRGR